VLTWLVNQVNSLRDRISSLWNAAWNWAVSKAQDAYNRAVAWASSQVSRIRSLAWSLYYQVRDYATSLRNSLASNILYWYNRAVGAAQALVKGARDLARVLYDRAKAFVITTRDHIVAGWNKTVNWIKDRLVQLWKDTVVFGTIMFDRAVAAAKAIADGSAGIINALIKQGKVELEEFKVRTGLADPLQSSLLLQFLQNPGNFILAYVWKMFFEFLEWSLALAMGSVNVELPPLPSWFGEGSGSVIPAGTGPPPGSSGLAPPLKRTWVSGYKFRQGHPGIDLWLLTGTPVYAMHEGIIEVAKWSTIGYGFYVQIRGDEWWSLYAHLETLNVVAGQVVSARDTIGLGNSTGNSTGPHLHLEIKHRGTYIDPITVL